MSDDILDPAHDGDNTGTTSVGAAGLSTTGDPKGDKKDEVVVSEDGNIVERAGVKYMRAEALHNERAARQKAEQTLSSLEPLMPEFNEFLTQRQQRQQATVGRAAQSQADSDYTSDELEGFAINAGYYKEDGTTPDTSRAQKALDIMSGISRRQVRREVQPVAQASTRELARANREKGRTNTFVDGKPIAESRYIDAAYNSLPDDMIADPQVASLTSVIAAGLEYLDHRKNGTLPGRAGRARGGEPMHLERGSGRFDGDDGEMSQLDLAAARARGKTPEQWSKQIKQANKGSVVLDEV